LWAFFMCLIISTSLVLFVKKLYLPSFYQTKLYYEEANY
jgi:hypothetical protein